jgi:hypothetical protein
MPTPKKVPLDPAQLQIHSFMQTMIRDINQTPRTEISSNDGQHLCQERKQTSNPTPTALSRKRRIHTSDDEDDQQLEQNPTTASKPTSVDCEQNGTSLALESIKIATTPTLQQPIDVSSDSDPTFGVYLNPRSKSATHPTASNSTSKRQTRRRPRKLEEAGKATDKPKKHRKPNSRQRQQQAAPHFPELHVS